MNDRIPTLDLNDEELNSGNLARIAKLLEIHGEVYVHNAKKNSGDSNLKRLKTLGQMQELRYLDFLMEHQGITVNELILLIMLEQ
jgi:hypothetical protein